MAFTLQESHIDNAGSSYPITSQFHWRGQSWTTTSAYTLSRVEVNIQKLGTPGTVYVLIQGVADLGLGLVPDGSTIASGTIDVATISTSYGFVPCDLTVPVALNNATQYAIVVHVDPVDAGNSITWSLGDDLYAGGAAQYDNNGGNSWDGPKDADLGFKTYSGEGGGAAGGFMSLNTGYWGA